MLRAHRVKHAPKCGVQSTVGSYKAPYALINDSETSSAAYQALVAYDPTHARDMYVDHLTLGSMTIDPEYWASLGSEERGTVMASWQQAVHDAFYNLGGLSLDSQGRVRTDAKHRVGVRKEEMDEEEIAFDDALNEDDQQSFDGRVSRCSSATLEGSGTETPAEGEDEEEAQHSTSRTERGAMHIVTKSGGLKST